MFCVLQECGKNTKIPQIGRRLSDFYWLDKQQSLSVVVILAKIATNRDFTVSGMAVTVQQIFVILYKG